MLVAEDDPTVRDALEALVRSEQSLELAASVEDAPSAVEAAMREQPDVALVDVRMPGGGASAARGIRSCAPGTRVLAFTAHDDRETVLQMLEAGAIGYLLKGDSIDEIVEAIHRAADGQAPLSAEVAGRGHRRASRAAQRRPPERDADAAPREAGPSRARRERTASAWCSNRSAAFRDSMVGAEALARFQGPPKRGPDRWFAEAEEVGLGRELELATAKAALAALPSLPPEIYLSLNVSPKTLLSGSFRKLVLENSDPTRVVVEVTEHARIEDYERLNSAFDRLRDAGVRLAIDDAGAGFASLRHILRLAPDFIKLDRTLIDGIEYDRSRQALAAGLISFAEKIEATIIAEGIEHSAEVDVLTALGVGYGQGFFIAKPAPLPLKTTRFRAGLRRRRSRAVAR